MIQKRILDFIEIVGGIFLAISLLLRVQFDMKVPAWITIIWAPMLEYDNGLDDLYGILCISGNNNSVIANHISEIIHTQSIKPAGAKPVIIHIVSGKGNYISDNHIVATTEATDEQTKASDSCFSAQVDALTTTDKLVALDVTAVLVEKESVQNTILDSGSEGQVIIDRTVNAFRATPVPGV